MADVFGGAGLGGVLGFGLAAMVLLLAVRDAPTRDIRVRSVRLIARAFIAGGAVLGLVVVILAATFGGPSSQALGLVGGLGIGAGSLGVWRASSGFDRRILTEEPLRARARTIVSMAFAETLTMASVVALILAVELNAP